MSKDKKRTENAACETSTEPNRPLVRIASVKKKIGESRDNLQGRSDWFERHTTGKK